MAASYCAFLVAATASSVHSLHHARQGRLPAVAAAPVAVAAAAACSRRPAPGFPGAGRRLLGAWAVPEDDRPTATDWQFGAAPMTEVKDVRETTDVKDDLYTPSSSVEDVTTGEQSSSVNLSDLLDFKLGSGDVYPTLLYGAGALLVVWVSSALVGAIDSLPLFPKVMEVFGLGFSVWFTYRYLIFKENRDELFEKIEEIREQIVGSSDDD